MANGRIIKLLKAALPVWYTITMDNVQPKNNFAIFVVVVICLNSKTLGGDREV